MSQSETPTAEQPIVLSGGVLDTLEPRLSHHERVMRLLDDRLEHVEAQLRSIRMVTVPAVEALAGSVSDQGVALAVLGGRLAELERRVLDMVVEVARQARRRRP